MAGHVALDGAEQFQLFHGIIAAQSQRGVERRGAVPFGEHKAIPVGIGRVLGIDAHGVEIEHREHVQHGQGAARVAGGAAVHRLHSQQPRFCRSDGQRFYFFAIHDIFLSFSVMARRFDRRIRYGMIQHSKPAGAVTRRHFCGRNNPIPAGDCSCADRYR